MNSGRSECRDCDCVRKDENHDLSEDRIAKMQTVGDSGIEFVEVLLDDDAGGHEMFGASGDSRPKENFGEKKQRKGEKETGIGAEVSQEGDRNAVPPGRTLDDRQNQQRQPGQRCGEHGASHHEWSVRLDEADASFDAIERATFHQEKWTSIWICVLSHDYLPWFSYSAIPSLRLPVVV